MPGTCSMQSLWLFVIVTFYKHCFSVISSSIVLEGCDRGKRNNKRMEQGEMSSPLPRQARLKNWRETDLDEINLSPWHHTSKIRIWFWEVIDILPWVQQYRLTVRAGACWMFLYLTLLLTHCVTWRCRPHSWGGNNNPNLFCSRAGEISECSL